MWIVSKLKKIMVSVMEWKRTVYQPKCPFYDDSVLRKCFFSLPLNTAVFKLMKLLKVIMQLWLLVFIIFWKISCLFFNYVVRNKTKTNSAPCVMIFPINHWSHKQLQGCLEKSLKWLLINYQILLPNFLVFSYEWLGEFDIASKGT